MRASSFLMARLVSTRRLTMLGPICTAIVFALAWSAEVLALVGASVSFGIISTTPLFSADGKILVAGARTGTLKIWNVAKRNEQALLHSHEECLRVAFSSNTKTLASTTK